LQELSVRYREMLHEKKASATLLRLADSLFMNPVVNPTMTAKAFKLTYVSAQKNIDKLVDAGILQEITGRQRGRIYVAGNIIDVLERQDALQLKLNLQG
jgi:Fic family protein